MPDIVRDTKESTFASPEKLKKELSRYGIRMTKPKPVSVRPQRGLNRINQHVIDICACLGEIACGDDVLCAHKRILPCRDEADPEGQRLRREPQLNDASLGFRLRSHILNMNRILNTGGIFDHCRND